MTLQIERDYRLRLMDFDLRGRIQPAALLDVFQDMATIHAQDMGIGHDDMLAKGLFWVVARVKYEMTAPPSRYQVLRARTWPHDPTRYSFSRDYTLSDAAGDVLVKATSEWVVVDARTRKFASLADVYGGPPDFPEERTFEKRLKKIPDFEDAGEPALTVVPRFSDVDVNGHVNNAKYANYIVDALELDERWQIRSLQIDYRHEVLPGAPLAIYVHRQDELVKAKGIVDGKDIAFACSIQLALR